MIGTQLRHKNIQLVAGLFFVLIAGLFQRSMHALLWGTTAIVSPPPEFLGLSIDPRIARRLLGLRVVMADLLWIDLLLKTDVSKAAHPYTPLYRAAKIVVALDPDNLYAYYISGMYLSVITDDIKGATAILREGAQYIIHSNQQPIKDDPTAWKVFFMLGYNLMFEELEIEEGSQWILKAAELPNAPLYVKNLAKSVSTERGRLEVGARVLVDIYRRVSHSQEKARVEKKMLEITAKQELLDLNEKFKNYLSSTGAYALQKQRAFQLFMRSIGHNKKDVLGRSLSLDGFGRIVSAKPH